MADDIARLGYEIDSSQARTAAGDLDKMAMAAGKAAGSADKLKVSNNGISATYKSAALSAKQLATTNALLQQHFVKTGNAAQVMGRQVQASTQHATNLMFQFQDIGMMLAAGQNPLMLAMQQGTQVSGVFQQMKNSGQSAFSGIKAGLMAAVNPMSLLTIGVIAGGAALVQWGVAALSAGEEADKLQERLEGVLEAQRALSDEIRGFQLGVSAEELVIQDAINEKRRSILELQQKITPQTRIQINSEKQLLQELLGQLDTQQKLEAEKARQKAATDGLADAEREIWSAATDTGRQYEENNRIAQLLRDGVSATVIEAMQLSGIDMASPISAAAERAAVLASNLGIALSAAMAIESWQASASVSAEDQAMGMPIDNRGAAAAGRAAGMQYELSQSLKAARKGKGGGGGTSKAQTLADQRERELEAFITSLQTESETLEAWRTEQLEMLAQYNDTELAAIGGKNEAKLRLEQEYLDKSNAIMEQEKRAKMAGYQTMFGDLAGLMQTGSDKLFKIGQAAAIASATIDGWQAATAAWKWGMSNGGPALAAAATAASLLKTGAMIASIAKQSPNGGGGGSSAAPSSASGTTQQAQPERRVMVSLDGPDWVKGIIEPIMTQIYEQTGDGTKVVFSR